MGLGALPRASLVRNELYLLNITLRGNLLGDHSPAVIIGSAAEANSRSPLVRIVKQEVFPMLR